MKVYSRTHTGLVRTNNQDYFATGEFDDGTVWCVVCDGMGGAAGGDVASKTAVELISKRIEGNYNRKMKKSSVANLLESAINLANIQIYDMAKANENLSGMGTTVVAAIATEDTVYVSHAGDSRAYIISDGEINQITVDHSLVQEMVNRGEITAKEAENHPIKHYITRALGVEDSISVDFSGVEFKKNDTLIVCTDGLTNHVKKENIASIVNRNTDDDVTQKLVDAAMKDGGSDNITVVAVMNI